MFYWQRISRKTRPAWLASLGKKGAQRGGQSCPGPRAVGNHQDQSQTEASSGSSHVYDRTSTGRAIAISAVAYEWSATWQAGVSKKLNDQEADLRKGHCISPREVGLLLRPLAFLLGLSLNVFFNILFYEGFIDYRKINNVTLENIFLSFIILNKGDDISSGKNSP